MSAPRRAIVTCGPSYEPIDEVRRLTNFSTGELGTILASALAASGVSTVCLRGIGATYTATPGQAELRTFATNDDLAGQLRALAGQYDAIYHAAALCDFRVATMSDAGGEIPRAAKVPTNHGALTLHLVPTAKLLPQLRSWFPRARIIGWKYELNGTRNEALQRARAQINEAQSDACVVNGRAYGEGFGIATIHEVVPCADKQRLAEQLVRDLLVAR